MIIELNIGLNIEGSLNNQRQRDSRADHALGRIRCYTKILGTRRAQSTTEDTLVLSVEREGSESAFYNEVYTLASDLSQDCIAVYQVDADNGALIGPRAGAWGEFNPEFFIRFASEVAA